VNPGADASRSPAGAAHRERHVNPAIALRVRFRYQRIEI